MVQRYEATTEWGEAVMSKYDFGDYVAYEDYQKLEAELEALRQQVNAPADGGWIEWGGEGEPLECEPPEVEVKFRNGDVGMDYANIWWWGHSGDEDDIIAYRVVK